MKIKTIKSVPLTATSLKLKASRGFTLIELVVAISIFVIITTVVLVSQRKFGGTILITNLAYDVALGIRQAQVYGISVKAVTGSCVGESGNTAFDCPYGVHFSSSNYFVLFTDLDRDGLYDKDADDGAGCIHAECVKIYKIEQGNTISNFCTWDDFDCKVGGTHAVIDTLDIIFHRPDPEPTITTKLGSNWAQTGYTEATITVSSPQGVTKKVEVSTTGQISVK